MNWLAYVIVGATGLGLVGSGLYHHLNFKKLRADPVLIGGCYLFGGVLVASCLV